ncbi:hypothetical protein [Verrucosispora sp. NA02020]|uniref:hypothetical protein n=1 Tax=Verrucosispora sp. NA02020 TaxID=2742132 RepID=UPI0015904D88|nr:hypothetical protein [Verrucosispora sp. NA02020]QKW12197.1 hypothetical protein HUT12_04895 [Verrucosispora sp. NA02020]
MSASPQPDLATAAARHGSLAVTRLVYPQPARHALRNLAATIATSPCDTASGRYDLIRYQQWRSESSPGEPETLQEVVRWNTGDLSGAQLATRHPPGPAPMTKHWWDPGQIPSDIPVNPILDPRQPFVIIDRLRHDNDRDYTAADAVQAIAELVSWHNARRDERATVLTTLAQYDQLVFYPRVSDRAGRVGVAIAATDSDDSQRRVLVVDPVTGDVLAYETARPDEIGAWRPTSYLLVMGRTRVDARWWEQPGPPPPARLHPQRARIDLSLFATPCLPMPEGDSR